MLSPQGVEGYVKPVIDLYEVHTMLFIILLTLNFQSQKAMKINSHPHPRTPHLMAVIKNYNNRRLQENELNAIIDRGLDTEAQFATFREFQKTIEILLLTDTFIAYRTRMDLLISQYMLLCSEDRRKADLCDLVAVESLNEAGFQKNIQMLVLRLRQGKVHSFLSSIF